MKKVYGYVRVSTKEQNEDRQLLALSDIVLQVLSFVAENERKNIKDRQREGIEAALRRGVRFGRPERSLPDNFEQIYGRWLLKEISGVEAARQCNMPVSLFYRKAGKLKENTADRAVLTAC